MPLGFGQSELDEGVEVRPQIRDIQDRMSEDIHAIKERYVQPQLFQPASFSLTAAAPGNVAKLDLSQMKVNSLIISPTAGTLNLWFGDYTANLTSPPHAQFVALGAPSQLMIPLGGYTFTIASTGGAATVTIIPCAL